MNYYEHHLGDFARDAGHLSMVEEGAYRRLIDAYYARESPLPLDISKCKKLARVTRAPAEHRAIEYVLAAFFVRRADGYHQKRCDEEIQRFKAKSEAARSSANARWAHNGRNANASANGMRTHRNGDAKAMLSSLQSPVTKKDTPPTPSRGRVRGNSKSTWQPPTEEELGLTGDVDWTERHDDA